MPLYPVRMFAEPLNETRSIVRAVVRVAALVAVAALPVHVPLEPEAFPVKFAVIVPATKLPEASRLTIIFTVFAAVAPCSPPVAAVE